jgi:3-oxoacyl-[acyl-carrier protein] reductase
MEERWALVTGGAGGLGEAISRHLAARGYGVLIHCHRSVLSAGAIADDVRRAGGRAEVLAADLASAVERASLIARAASISERLDVLVHNLGVFAPLPLDGMKLETFEEALDLTLVANFHLTQLAMPLLERGARARIVSIGDSHADRLGSHPFATGYHIAKLGVNVLVRSYAEALGPKGITANMISPGFLANSVGERPDIPAGRPGRFEDILGALDYLLSDAADYVSGANLAVTGGWNL